MTKTKKVKKKSCVKVPKKVEATSPVFVTPCTGHPMDQLLHDINSNGGVSELWPHVVKKIETLQRSKMTCFICFVVIAFFLIAAILVLYNENRLSVSYLLVPCFIISVFKAAEIFFSELTNN